MEVTEENTIPIKAASSYTSTSLHDAVKLRLGKQGLAAVAPETIPQTFRECCQKYADCTALAYRREYSTDNADWQFITYAEYEQRVEQVALMLLHVGLQPRSSVGILANNCPEWFFCELATIKAGAVVAGIYPSNSAEAVAHVLDSSDATICIVDNAQQMAKVRAVKGRLPRLRAVIQLNGPYEEHMNSSEQGFYCWDEIMAMEFGDGLRAELERRENDVCANECAILVFTSGTTGLPKGAMLSHDSVLFDCKSYDATVSILQPGKERFISYLPLNHVAAQVIDVYFSMLKGACVYFADKNALKDTFIANCLQIKPTFIFGVPRVYEKIQEKILSENVKLPIFAKCLTEKSRRVVEQYYLDIINKKSPSKWKYWIASKVTHQIKLSLGMECIKFIGVGGAPSSEELKKFYLSIDIQMLEVYGMTEGSGVLSWSNELTNLQSLGKPLEGIELKIENPDGNGHGEICVRGRTIFMGYVNNVEKTKETIKEDGFCYSGDLGYLDTDGYLYITGRIKELIITAGGENLPPLLIENNIKQELKAISNAIVIGDRRKYLTVLLTLKTEMDGATGLPLDTLRYETKEWLQSLGISAKHLSEVLSLPVDIDETEAINTPITLNALVRDSIDSAIKRANSHAQSNTHKVQKFAILPHDLSVPTGEIGPTLKIRRDIILKKYAKIIERMYQEK